MYLLCSVQQILVANISTSDQCDVAYEKFVSFYQKQPSASSQAIFCSQLQYVAINGGKLFKNSDINPAPSFRRLPQRKSSSSAPNCSEELCFSSDPVKPLKRTYKSISLYEAGLSTVPKQQGDCGSCWAFGTMAVFENSVLRQKPVNTFWSQKTDLSEQYLMSNSFDYFTSYCIGGDFVFAANYFNDKFQTIESEINIKYDYAALEPMWNQKQKIQTVVQPENYLKPYQLLNIEGSSNMKTPVVGIHTDTRKTFSKNTIWQIKSYLSRGVAVSAAMYTETNYPKFKAYPGTTPLDVKCPGDESDHQVTFVGYGYKNGEEVWIIKNSWGQDWGANGYLYVPIGKDSYCTERYAFAILPIGFQFNEELYQNIGNHERGGIFDLDSDNGETVKRPLQQWIVWVSVLGGVLAVSIIVIISIYISKKIKTKKEYKPMIIDTAFEVMR
ncbi:Cathepsin_L [Hexamita inflata]|uniref:Cathepsin_L n=1 Tax=Hexamita inflata TaxID=28002 RepID=A0ABP1KJA5_9EUKA